LIGTVFHGVEFYREAESCSASQKNSRLSWKPKVRKGPPLDTVLSQLNPVHTRTPDIITSFTPLP